MITGTVSDRLEAVIRLQLRGPIGAMAVDAILDTGFNGAIAIPEFLADQLGLLPSAVVYGRLADGSTITYSTFQIEVEWDGQPRFVIASAMGNECLIGMKLLEGASLRIEVVEGGSVRVDQP